MVVHLYWQYTNQRMFERIRRGYSLCGKQFGREQLTKWPDDCECEKCLAALAQKEKASITEDRGQLDRNTVPEKGTMQDE
jgi:hypothetical protein